MRTLNIEVVAQGEIKYYMVDLLRTMILGNNYYSDHSLVLFSCSNVLQDVGSLIAEWSPVNLIITLDHNLLIVHETAVRHKFQVDKIVLHKKSNNPLIVCLKYSIPGLMFSTNK